MCKNTQPFLHHSFTIATFFLKISHQNFLTHRHKTRKISQMACRDSGSHCNALKIVMWCLTWSLVHISIEADYGLFCSNVYAEHSLQQPYTQISSLITLCIAVRFSSDGRYQQVTASASMYQNNVHNLLTKTSAKWLPTILLIFIFSGGRWSCRHMLYWEKYHVLTRTYVLTWVVLLAAVLASVEAR